MDDDHHRGPDLDTMQAAAVAGGGVLLAASAFLPWIAKGAGSAMSLRDVGDFLLGDRWPTISRWFGLLAYVVPVCGGLALIGAGLRAATARRILSVVAATAGLLLAIAGVAFLVRSRLPGPGYAVAVLGELLVLGGVWAIGRNR